MSSELLKSRDLGLLKEKGISPEEIEIQLENFRNGFPPISLVAPATVGDGIVRLSEDQINSYAKEYQQSVNDLKLMKFVPASGAASRMFKNLFEFLNSEASRMEENTDPAILEFWNNLNDFAFIDELRERLEASGNEPGTKENLREVIKAVVEGSGLNYGQLPKGLIKFHRYPDESRTSVEEHMVEAAEYCRDGRGEVNLHFTVSREHLDHFIDLLNTRQQVHEEKFGVKYNVEFSLQRAFTDKMAVDPENRPFRLENGSILFRPGGHGALLTNLNELDADLIFIKNVDNVSPDRMKPVSFRYKKALAGILLENRQKAFEFIKALDSGDNADLAKIQAFLENTFNTRLSELDTNLDHGRKIALLRRKLDRPIRVCGMVKNEGEPGGGPFWANNPDGSVSLQIVESAQINFNDRLQSEIAGSATHFNPVDLVCATRDRNGNKFDLQLFTDPQTGLISEKSADGRDLKAQELPGLWNGSMSDWNTIFVEVPIETFTPVKTINDLLRPDHRA